MRLERIGASLAALPAAQRDALGLAVYAQLSHREIALKLDVPLGTAKARVRRGLRDVRRALARSHPTSVASPRPTGARLTDVAQRHSRGRPAQADRGLLAGEHLLGFVMKGSAVRIRSSA